MRIYIWSVVKYDDTGTFLFCFVFSDKVMAIEACSLASAAAAGVLVLLLGSLSLFVCGESCCCCGSSMRWVLKTMDTVILLFGESQCGFLLRSAKLKKKVCKASKRALWMYCKSTGSVLSQWHTNQKVKQLKKMTPFLFVLPCWWISPLKTNPRSRRPYLQKQTQTGRLISE